MAEISFLCMQLAGAAGNQDEFNRLLRAGISHSGPSGREFLRMYVRSDPRIPEDVKHIFDTLKSLKYDPATFMLASYIKDSNIVMQRFLTSDAPDEKIEQAKTAFNRLSCI